MPQICWVSGARLAATDLPILPRGKKTNEDECTLLSSWFIQLPTKAIFKAPLRPWWGRVTQCGTLTLDEMCNFYPCGPTSCVLAAGWGVHTDSGSSHILTRCLSPRLEPNAMGFLLSFPDDRCAGMKMIRPAGGRFAATFSSGFLRSGPPPRTAFFLNTILRSKAGLLCFRNTMTIFRSLLFSKVIKELPQRCNSEQRTDGEKVCLGGNTQSPWVRRD